MAERATIARPYAKAAFEYARAANAFSRWSENLAAAAAMIADPRVRSITKSPLVTTEQLVEFITEVEGPKPDPHFQNFVRLLAENRRLLLLPEIAVHYEALRATAENTVDVEVVSAVALNAAQTAELEAAVSAHLKRQVRMQNSVDATLLGGAVVRAGDLVIDGSLKGRLQRLATELRS
jgi:F-type H+-transporting ATPase subunit delta